MASQKSGKVYTGSPQQCRHQREQQHITHGVPHGEPDRVRAAGHDQSGHSGNDAADRYSPRWQAFHHAGTEREAT